MTDPAPARTLLRQWLADDASEGDIMNETVVPAGVACSDCGMPVRHEVAWRTGNKTLCGYCIEAYLPHGLRLPKVITVPAEWYAALQAAQPALRAAIDWFLGEAADCRNCSWPGDAEDVERHIAAVRAALLPTKET